MVPQGQPAEVGVTISSVPNRQFKGCRHFATVAEATHLVEKP